MSNFIDVSNYHYIRIASPSQMASIIDRNEWCDLSCTYFCGIKVNLKEQKRMWCSECIKKWLNAPNDYLKQLQIIQEDKLYTDDELEELWKYFEKVPVNQETEETENDFLHFPKGTSYLQVVRWFYVRYSKGFENLVKQKVTSYHTVESVQSVSKRRSAKKKNSCK